MTIDTVDAWVLSKRWSGESSALVTFFTQEHGVLNALWKGGRSPKKQALMQSFTPIWVSLARNASGSYYYVRQLEMTGPTLPLKGDALFAGLYCNELLTRLLLPQDAHPTLYLTYTYTLHAIQDACNKTLLEQALRRFEWALLVASGYAMSLTEEARTGNPVVPDALYRLLPEEGFIRASQGIAGSHIMALSQDNLEEPGVLIAAKRLMRQALHHALGGKAIKTREWYLALQKQ